MRLASRQVLCLCALIVLVLGLRTAFAASNTVSTSRAGLGQGAVSGFTVTAIDYTLSAADPSQVTVVRFRAVPAPREVWAQFPPSSLTWRSCTLLGANATCNLVPSVSVAVIGALRVSAAR
jgi:hypothetical protein